MGKQHRVPLSNGQVLLIEETTDALHIAHEDGHHIGTPAMYICRLQDDGVTVMTNSADAVTWLTTGLRDDAVDAPTVHRTLRIDLKRVDWEELRAQKRTLNELLDRLLTPNQLSNKERYALDGIRHLLDYVQDQAADVLGEQAVFGAFDEDD